MHKHHITPRHMGGSDDPSNITKVSIEVHANLHKQLWEEFGHWQDEIAWKALSGQIGSKEATRLAQIESGKKNLGRVASQETREKMRQARLGKKQSVETKEKIGAKHTGKRVSQNTKAKLKAKMIGKKNRVAVWEIIHPDGNKEIVTGLREFCRKNNLTHQAMHQVSTGRNSHHKGFRCKKVNNT